MPGIMERKVKPDYKRCVEISTHSSLKQMIVPGLLAIVAPVVVGLWSVEALGGLLAGSLVTGILMAIMMANAGGAWDNGKKQIEGGYKGDGKGSDRHKAAVVGNRGPLRTGIPDRYLGLAGEKWKRYPRGISEPSAYRDKICGFYQRTHGYQDDLLRSRPSFYA